MFVFVISHVGYMFCYGLLSRLRPVLCGFEVFEGDEGGNEELGV
jgi:hypothetical protein